MLNSEEEQYRNELRNGQRCISCEALLRDAETCPNCGDNQKPKIDPESDE